METHPISFARRRLQQWPLLWHLFGCCHCFAMHPRRLMAAATLYASMAATWSTDPLKMHVTNKPIIVTSIEEHRESRCMHAKPKEFKIICMARHLYSKWYSWVPGPQVAAKCNRERCPAPARRMHEPPLGCPLQMLSLDTLPAG